MANNQKKLKAFVRYDGSGRVVASSLILRKNKPRVGRWFEIPTYECCNDTTSSTTTAAPVPTQPFTTTNYYSSSDACQGINVQTSTPVYVSDTSFANGTTLWLDAQLTQPYQTGMPGWVAFAGFPGVVYNTTSNMGTTIILSSQSC